MTLRLFWIGWLFHLKGLTNSLFFVLVSVLQPVIFASIAFFMFESGSRTGTLLYAALGAGLMGIWSATLFGSGGAIQWQRWQGTLELMVGAPPPFLAILLPLTVATSTIGIYSVVATLAWGRIFFGTPLDFAHPLQLAVALPVDDAQPRSARAPARLDVRPLPAGERVLEPARVPGLARDGPPRAADAAARLGRPDRVGAFADWGMRAIREAAFGGSAWPEIGLCIALGLVYLALGALALRNFERLARSRATLSLT